MGKETTIKRIAILTLVLLLGVNGAILAAHGTKVPIVPSINIVGTGEPGSNNGKSSEATFNTPYGIAYSKQLNALIVADTGNHMIRSIDLKTMEVKTIAGLQRGEDRFGLPGGGYVDGDVKRAMFNRPRGVAVAENGAILVADTGNHAIRQIFNGKVSTIAGGKLLGYEDGKGADAKFNTPSALAIDDKNNIYVSDTLNNAIRKIDTGGNVTTYLGKKENTTILNEPAGIFFTADGELLVADSGNHQIKKITGKNKYQLLAGNHSLEDPESGYWIGEYLDGPKEASYFNFPKGVGMKEGTILVADSYNHVIRALDDTRVQTLVGGGIAGEEIDEEYKLYLDGPAGLLYVKDTLFISDRWNNRIVLIPDEGKILDAIGAPRETDGIGAYLDGRAVEFPDVLPLESQGNVLLPLRALAEAWGAEIDWDGENREIRLEKMGNEYLFTFEKEDFVLKESRALSPIELIEKKLPLKVKWLDDENAVFIQSK
ncbi:MAG: stalk domain-containing protein [Tissierellaceae bacterium]